MSPASPRGVPAALRVGFDMVGAQTPGSRGRGIGRYVDGLVAAFLRAGPALSGVLYFHDDLPIDPHWKEMGAEIRLCGPLRERRARLQDLVDENPDRVDAVVVTSPLLEPLGDPACGLPAAPGGGLVLASIVYDLIPYLFREHYLRDPKRARDYYERLQVLSGYDALLAISGATRDDLVRLLGVSPGRVFTIGTGSDSSWSPGEPSLSLLARLGVRRPYVLSVAATDPRKNSARLMEAVGRCTGPRPLQLVLCHEVSPEETDLLHALAETHGVADRLLVTGRVDDETLRELYRGCAVFALPSRYEGFGLPLLEAMRCGAPVIGGRNSSQAEVVGPRGALTEPDDVAALARLLERMFDPEERSRAVARGLLHSARFRWDPCVARLAESLRTVQRRRGPRSRRAPGRLRIGVFSPLPPVASGIADQTAALLEHMGASAEIDVFHAGRERPYAVERSPGLGVYDERLFETLDRARPYDVLLHQMGNSLHHDFIHRALLRHGGVVSLHEINLAGLHADLAVRNGWGVGYIEEEIRFDQPRRWRELLPELTETGHGPGELGRALCVSGVYLARRVLQAAERVLVTDPQTRLRLQEVYPESLGKTAVVPLGATARRVPPREKKDLRRVNGLPGRAFIFGVFGIVSSTKYHLEIVEAFQALAREDPTALLLYVGRGPETREVQEKARRLALSGRVWLVEDPPNERFSDLVHAVDVGVNVRRPPTNWESSASLIELLAAGIPTIASRIDAFKGVPDHVVEGLDETLDPVAAIRQAMRRLRDSEVRRLELQEAALRHVSDQHDWHRVAQACLEHLDGLVKGGRGRQGGAKVGS